MIRKSISKPKPHTRVPQVSTAFRLPLRTVPLAVDQPVWGAAVPGTSGTGKSTSMGEAHYLSPSILRVAGIWLRTRCPWIGFLARWPAYRPDMLLVYSRSAVVYVQQSKIQTLTFSKQCIAVHGLTCK